MWAMTILNTTKSTINSSVAARRRPSSLATRLGLSSSPPAFPKKSWILYRYKITDDGGLLDWLKIKLSLLFFKTHIESIEKPFLSKKTSERQIRNKCRLCLEFIEFRYFDRYIKFESVIPCSR